MQPINQLEQYSFFWSQARLILAAVALFLGGVPPLLFFSPLVGLYGIFGLVLKLCWIVSGLASLYLFSAWNGAGRKLFGQKDPLDVAAFFVSVISGINLGLAGILGINFGMTISSNYVVFVIMGLIYLLSAFQLYRKWKVSGNRLFVHF